MRPIDLSYERVMKRSRRDESGCRICTYMKDNNGYPIVRWKNWLGIWSMTHASRVVYQWHHGPICDNRVVMHTCDNRSCVSIDHLIIGTQKQNMEDAVSKNRMANGERNGSCKLTDAEVEDIRKSRDTKASLAKRYGISIRHVFGLRAKETRKNATHRNA